MRRLRHRVPWPAWVPLGLATALAATVLAGPVPAEAAATASGAVLDPAHSSVDWRSPVYAKGTGGGTESCPDAAADPGNKVCDRFDLTVSVPDGYWDDNPEGGVPLSVRWDRPSADFDLYVYDDHGKQVASSAGTADPEATVIPRASGTPTTWSSSRTTCTTTPSPAPPTCPRPRTPVT
ncbi:hypothetical protein [Streptomyces sp. PanSC9]|uniref:hypothetical protein n=1 Tax=Streptomyces sp. PanSC9 TaxID=1520461 RepID=UPI0021A3E001|nr:hypothetical protein [Streptomyces sp. PanSC9]